MNVFRNILKALVVMVVLIPIIAICSMLILILLMDVTDGNYYKMSNWNMSDEEFLEEYVKECEFKLDELMNVYEPEYIKDIEVTSLDNGDSRCVIHLYNEQFTLELTLRDVGFYGSLNASLYFFGGEAERKDEQVLLAVLNGFVRYFGFDTKNDESENHFERLRSEAVNEGLTHGSYYYHFDEMVGDVGYSVILQNSHFGYYYKMEKNADIAIVANRYYFEGVLNGK